MQIDKTQWLSTQPIGKLLREYSIPAIIGSTVMIVYNIVDRIYIGQGVGAYAISGLALTLPIAALQTAFGTLIGVGGSARISIVLGRQDKDRAERILAHSFMLSIAFSLLFIAAIQLYLPEILKMLGGTEQTIPYALEYMKIVNAGSIFTTITYTFSNIMRSTGYPRKSMSIMVAGAALNTLLDPLFIFVFDMGIKGAAYATVISMFCTTLVVIHHYLMPQSYIRFRRNCFRFKPEIARNIFAIGVSPFIMNIMAAVITTLFNNTLLKHGGDLAIGAYGIIGSLVMLIIMILIGLSQGMQPILGYNYGAGIMPRLRQTLKLGMIVATAITTTGFFFGVFFPHIIVSGFTTDPQLTAIAENGIQIVMVAFPLVGIHIVITTFFQSIGWVKSAILLTLARQLVFIIPLLYILPRYFGLNGVWAITVVADVLSFTIAVVALYLQRRKLFEAPTKKEIEEEEIIA